MFLYNIRRQIPSIKLSLAKYLILFFLIISNPKLSKADTCTSASLTIAVNATFFQRIFNFQCTGTQFINVNPTFPLSLINNPNEFNEIDLSPNFYTVVPVSQLCPFKNVYLLDLSFNQIISLDGIFSSLSCLSSLSIINFSNNIVRTPLLKKDFDDVLSSQLVSINLTNNQIPSIETGMFLKTDGSSRFPKLKYLGLANNLIRQLDLLWPLSLPNPQLFIDIKQNSIDSLVNQLGVSFNQPSFRYPMTGQRYFDALNNKLQYLDDNSLLQYGLQTVEDFYSFITRLGNYDFRQSNLGRTFLCYCPSTGSQTITWFKSVKNFLNLSYPIFQLYCSNIAGHFNMWSKF